MLPHRHPCVPALAFPSFPWVAAVAIYGYLVAATLAILTAPLYLKRPVAFVLYCGALLAHLYALPSLPGLEWFVPFLFLKLLLAHLLPEAAYRPGGEAR